MRPTRLCSNRRALAGHLCCRCVALIVGTVSLAVGWHSRTSPSGAMGKSSPWGKIKLALAWLYRPADLTSFQKSAHFWKMGGPSRCVHRDCAAADI